MELISLISSDILSYKFLNIVFDDLDHALFVGNNGTGKSSIFDILCLVLFGESPRKRYKRVVRDIPINYIHCGNMNANLRQMIDDQLDKEGIISMDIRSREIGRHSEYYTKPAFYNTLILNE